MARLLFDFSDWITVVQPLICWSRETPSASLAMHHLQTCDCCACARPRLAVAASATAHAIMRIVADILLAPDVPFPARCGAQEGHRIRANVRLASYLLWPCETCCFAPNACST